MIDWAFTWEILPALVRALGVTVLATVLGMVLALPLGLVWTLLRRARPWIARPVDLWVDFVRSTPLLIQIYLLYYALPLVGPALSPTFSPTLSPMITGVLALGVHYSTYTAEVYRAGIDGVPRGQWQAASALGMSRAQTWRRVILPQAIPPVIPALGNYLIAMFKDTPMLAAITVMELLQTAKVIGAERFRYLEPLTLVGLLFLAVSLLASHGVRTVEQRWVVRHG